MKSKEEKLIDLYTEDLITKSEYTNRRNEIKNTIIGIDADLITLESQQEEVKQNIDFKKMFIESLSNLKTVKDKQEANKILKKIIRKIEVNDDKEVFIYLNF